MEKSVTLSFCTDETVAEAISLFAKFKGLSISDYIEQAILEKNDRTMTERVAFISKALVEHELADKDGQDGMAKKNLV